MNRNDGKKRVILRYLLSPTRLNHSSVDRLDSITFCRNKLEGKAFSQVAVPANIGKPETISCDLLFRSIGFHSQSIDGLQYDIVKGYVPNSNGCILSTLREDLVEVGMYVTGWAKSGAQGMVVNTFRNSIETVNNVRNHLSKRYLTERADPKPIIDDLTNTLGKRTSSYADWKKVNAYEIEEGRRIGKVREKYGSVERFFEILNTKRKKNQSIEL